MSFYKKTEKILQEIDLEFFGKIASDVFTLAKTAKITFDVSVFRIRASYTQDFFAKLKKEYGIDRKASLDICELVGRIFRDAMAGNEEDVLEQFKTKNKIKKQVAELFKIANGILKENPWILDRFYILSFSKIGSLTDLGWQVDIKTADSTALIFEKSDRYSTCVLHFVLGTAAHGREKTEAKGFVFEASINDVEKLIRELSVVKEKMIEVKKELAGEMSK